MIIESIEDRYKIADREGASDGQVMINKSAD